MDPTNPLMQMLMRTLFRPPQERPELPPNAPRGQLRAPLMDSLAALTNRPMQIRDAKHNIPGGLAYVSTNEPSTVRFTELGKTEGGQQGFDKTLVHEAGHVAYFNDQIPTYVHNAVFSKYWDAVDKDPFFRKTYGSSAPRELLAEAFKNGYYYLQETSSRPEISRQLLGQLEQATPGTSNVVAWMLRKDIFEDHPLRRKLNTTRSTVKLFGAADSVASSRIPTEVR